MASSSRRSPSVNFIASSTPASPIPTIPALDDQQTAGASSSSSSSVAGDAKPTAAQHHPTPYPHVKLQRAQSQSPFRYLNTLQHPASSSSVQNISSNDDWNEKHEGALSQDVALAPVSPSSSASRIENVIDVGRGQYRDEFDEKESCDEAPSIAKPSTSRLVVDQSCGPSTPVNVRNLSPVTCSSLQPPATAETASSHTNPPHVSKWLLRQRLRVWLPYLLYGATSLSFVLAIAFWRKEVFTDLDELSHWLRDQGLYGYLFLGSLIFVTTIPPLPLYSTLQVLSGYTFGALRGGVVSYISALLGALFVYGISRLYLRAPINRLLSHTASFRRVVRAIARRPSLLFLVRLAPYPYNMLNALLAGAPTLTFRTYAGCTALSLFKVWIHTSIGASVHSFAAYHLHQATPVEDDDGSAADVTDGGEEKSGILSQASTIIGLVLCIAIAAYLTYVARRAVNEELDDDADESMGEMEEGNGEPVRPLTVIERLHERERTRQRERERRMGNEEERAAFLASTSDMTSDSSGSRTSDESEQEMAEVQVVRLGTPTPTPSS